MKFPVWLSILFLSLSNVALAAPAPPPTPVRPVTDTYHGVRVVDPYRWLEKARDPEVERWTRAQDAYARGWLHALPSRAAIHATLERWFAAESRSWRSMRYRGGRFFVLESVPPHPQPMLVALDSPFDSSKTVTVVDPNRLDPAGTTAIDWFVPSNDGKRVAVSLSKGGSEVGSLYVFETDDGRQVGEPIPHVQNPTAGGSAAWNADDSGIFYTRYPEKGERPSEDMAFYQQVWFHRLGTSHGDDRYCIGRDFPRIAEIALSTSEDGRRVLAQVANGDGGQYAHYLLEPDGRWIPLTRFEDKVTEAAFGLHDDLYLLSHQGAPRGRLLRLALDHPTLESATVAVPQTSAVIEGFRAARDGLYVVDLVGGPSQLRRFSSDGRFLGKVAIPPICSVDPDLVHGQGDALYFRVQTYLSPPAWYVSERGRVRPTALAERSPVSFKDCEVVRRFATSKDGTRVPLNILMRKGTRRDGHNPTILYGYGGYSVSITPSFDANRRLWLDHGGIWVIANIRGGGEYGETWHHQGNLTRKQNVFDDFAAAARWLIAQRYTSPRRLAISGRSNGGLLMGAALTQHPELYRAVVSGVGIYDMLRVELDPNGAFNVTEFGTVKDPAQFKALYAYAPYYHVKRGIRYPAVLLTTGANDGRVNPAQSKKMTARLQSATASGRPILLLVNFHAGHGMGTSQKIRINELADTYAFLFHELGVKY
jgi:prolyl oligopeptidase